MQGHDSTARRSVPLRAVFSAWLFLCGALVLSGSLGVTLQAEGVAVGPGLRRASLDSSELVLGDLGCVACHDAGEAETRLMRKRAPLLGDVGARVTPQYLRALLSDPQGQKAGSTMPAMLHSLGTDRRDDMIDLLVHFLSSLGSKELTGVRGDQHLIEQGKELFHSVGCVACHGPQDTDEKSSMVSMPLGTLAHKTSVPALAAFLRDPVKVRPSGRMPSLNLSASESEHIAMFLLRDQYAEAIAGGVEKSRVRGLLYSYYESDQVQRIGNERFAGLTPKHTGVATSFDIGVRKRDSHFQFKWSGSIKISKAGEYRFHTRSDDGSSLWINGKRIVDNDGVHGEVDKSGTVTLDVGQHGIDVYMFERDGGEAMKVQWEGPGIKRQNLPAEVLSHLGIPMQPLGAEEFSLDANKAAAGKKLFASLGCASCHGGTDVQSQLKGRPLAQVAKNPNGGCMSSKPAQGLPLFAFDANQRKTVSAALASFNPDAKVDAKQTVQRSVAALNCIACHDRDGIGGPQTDADAFFKCKEGDSMGFEGRLPPGLDGVGNKLRSQWLEAVLAKKGSVRPFMTTRMPQFGAENVSHLVASFREADGGDNEKDSVSPELVRVGQKLVGTGGMSCVSCHEFGKFKSLGIPSVDLTQVAPRINKRWFREYLLDPQSKRKSTRMPQFWPEGKSVRPDILDGDTEAQIEAMWTFLSQGRKARPPLGLKKIGEELLVSDEAVIYRHWIKGVGARAIGVGYPEGVNLAFDAAGVRLGLFWQDGFIDAQRHRNGRGTGEVAPLGEGVIAFPAQSEFATLSSSDQAWPAESGRKAGFKFKGYSLDKVRRPTFKYSFGDVSVEDFFLDMPGLPSGHFKRTITLRAAGAAAGIHFRAAVSNSITQDGDVFVTAEGLQIRLPGQKAVVRESGGKKELLVPVVFQNGTARVVEVIEW